MRYKDSFMASFDRAVRLHFTRAHAMMETIGLYPGQQILMFVLDEDANGLSQREIANRMAVKPATIAVMIQRMEKSGFVVRSIDEKDKRITRISLTDLGKQTVSYLTKLRSQIREECLEGFSEEEAAQFQNFLDRMSKNLKNRTNNSKQPRSHSSKGGVSCHN
ncbi:MarR family winged helix-turn-helix transcriptional regulator [Massiliimalia timonensis]|uniref:MarR family transcriptional regulator n=1 Tax=Massiliimalia timonensis TaxID=1987501 RepID=A0A8J6TR29_9FIRM|nr:MarR family transcriptional regulator [Massiliimalia timonensis]MBC8610136.1 MarR family transcriptional regulator [Massiliimalia timonensis]MBS7176308.1 MarR family transcriptional regulator [Clostridiales bacterium]